MTTYPSINMNPKLIRKGGRKAPRITIDELRKHYSDFCKKHASDWDRDDDEIFDGYELETLEDLPAYLEKDVYIHYMENYCDADDIATGYHTLDNGFTFRGVCGSADWSENMYFILYWDGKKIRGYVPRYGNTVIVDCNGFEEMANEYWEVSDEQYKKWFNSPRVQALTQEEREKINEYHDATPRKSEYLPPTGPIKFNKFNKMGAGPAYRIANGYPVTRGDINWDAVLEDIKNRIVVVD